MVLPHENLEHACKYSHILVIDRLINGVEELSVLCLDYTEHASNSCLDIRDWCGVFNGHAQSKDREVQLGLHKERVEVRSGAHLCSTP